MKVRVLMQKMHGLMRLADKCNGLHLLSAGSRAPHCFSARGATCGCAEGSARQTLAARALGSKLRDPKLLRQGYEWLNIDYLGSYT